MGRYLFTRLLTLGASLLAASLVIFAAIEVVPGDPASYMLGMNAAPDTVAALREQMGLNQPLVWRYLHWVQGVLTGDLGLSYTYKAPVAGLIADRLAVSLPLAGLALVLAVVLAVPAGLLAARPTSGPRRTLKTSTPTPSSLRTSSSPSAGA